VAKSRSSEPTTDADWRRHRPRHRLPAGDGDESACATAEPHVQPVVSGQRCLRNAQPGRIRSAEAGLDGGGKAAHGPGRYCTARIAQGDGRANRDPSVLSHDASSVGAADEQPRRIKMRESGELFDPTQNCGDHSDGAAQLGHALGETDRGATAPAEWRGLLARDARPGATSPSRSCRRPSRPIPTRSHGSSAR
jgi:hypothetical protein